MAVVSISLNDKNIEDLDCLQQTLGLSNRSEAIRLCLRAAEAEMKEREDLAGEVEGVAIIVHSRHNDTWLMNIIHKNEDMIQTHLHSHLRNHKCLEVLIVRGEAEEIKSMLQDIHSKSVAEYVKFVRS